MNISCPKCHLEFDPVRWNKFDLQLPIDLQLPTSCRVCDKCIDDSIRHTIVDQYITNRTKTNLTLTNKDFNFLLHLMALSDRFEFYNWFLREASKFELMNYSVFSSTPVTSVYPSKLGAVINFICKEYGNELFDHLYNGWDNHSDSEKRSIRESMRYHSWRGFSNSELFIIYLQEKDDKKLKIDLDSISTIFNKLFDETFNISIFSEKDLDILIDIMKNNTNLDSWYNFAEGLNRDSLIQLIRSFVYIENIKPISYQPSNSPIISLCKLLLRPYEEYDKAMKNVITCNGLDNDLVILINWVLNNSKNRYLPFGENNFSSHSLEEYGEFYSLFVKTSKEISSMEEVLSKKRDNILNEISSLREEISACNKKIAQKEVLVEQNCKSMERISNLKQLLDLNPIEKLEIISKNSKHLQYYPEFLINIDKKYISRLDSETRSSLKSKLKLVKKGYYKKLTKFID